MCAAAQLLAVIADGNYSYSITVFFSKQSHSTRFERFFRRHHVSSNIDEMTDLIIDRIFDPIYLIRSHSLEMIEVESQTVFRYR